MNFYAYARLVPKNPSFQNVVTFTIIYKHLAHYLHIVISLHNYNNCSPIIHYIQFLYCIHLQTCIQLIYCMLDVCGYKLNRLPFPAPFQLHCQNVNYLIFYSIALPAASVKCFNKKIGGFFISSNFQDFTDQATLQESF